MPHPGPSKLNQLPLTSRLSAPHITQHCCLRTILRPQRAQLRSKPSDVCSRQSLSCLPNHLAQLADVSVDVMDASTAKTIATFLQPVLSASILFMFVRVPLSWYPNIDVKKFPWSVVVVPTEPLLGPTRKVVQPQGGVDLAPLVWVAVLSFVNEILLGPQGILNLLQRKAQM